MNLTIAGSYEQICKRRRSTEGSEAGGSSRGPSGQTSPAMLSPKKSPPHNKQVDQVSLLDGFDPQAQKSKIYGLLTSGNKVGTDLEKCLNSTVILKSAWFFILPWKAAFFLEKCLKMTQVTLKNKKNLKYLPCYFLPSVCFFFSKSFC